MTQPFQKADPAYRHFQYLEDLSTAYWYSEVLFTALSLKLFERLEQGYSELSELAEAAACRPAELERLMNVLHRMELVCRHEEHRDGAEASGTPQRLRVHWYNGQLARRFLIPGNPSYLGDYLLYRRYMQPCWNKLTDKVSLENVRRPHPFSSDDDYDTRNFNYVQATDAIMRQKAPEILAVLKREAGRLSDGEPYAGLWSPPVLDIGGGAGALVRHLWQHRLNANQKACTSGLCRADPEAVLLFDLPEVIRAARRIYAEAGDWEGIRTREGDFRTASFPGKRFGLIIMSNFLHAYGIGEARQLLHKAVNLLHPNGMLMIHDYFPDRPGPAPEKGALYDVNMMLNTFNGQCHESAVITKWLQEAGMEWTRTYDLESDTAVILSSPSNGHPHPEAATSHAAGRRPDTTTWAESPSAKTDEIRQWCHIAMWEGFRRATPVSPQNVITAPWVRLKCRFGCALYGKDLQCPPHGLSSHETREMLDSYTSALLLEGAPPGRAFHDRLLRLEKKAFLAGFYKAFVFGAGPCPLCASCAEDGICRHPEQARPAMEGSGIDVYATARRAGIFLEPVTEKDQYVKYIGLLLLE